VGVLLVGLVLVAVGAFGFVSASQVNDDAAPTKAQLRSIQAELATLTEQRDDAVADAQAALASAKGFDDKVYAVSAELAYVEERYDSAVYATDDIVACDDAATDLDRLVCSQSALETFTAYVDRLAEEISALKAATTELEEAIQ
jgi:predicted  nucleic acid-binding Zn-ribbon protein